MVWTWLLYCTSTEKPGYQIEYIGPLVTIDSISLKWKRLISSRFTKKEYGQDRDQLILKNYAHQISSKLSNVHVDIVFSPETIPITYLECNQPIVFWTDATFAGMIDYYSVFSNLSKETIHNGNIQEQSALERCSLAIYSSEWAAVTAVENYHVNPSKIKVVPFGANIGCNRMLKDIIEIVTSRPTDKCKLLFLGTDWFRKGGDIAFRVAQVLNEQGLKAELNVVGCGPNMEGQLPDFIISHGFINKSSQSGLKQLEKLLSECHFLILPTHADCTPIVFSEANSFGVPVITINTGGIPSVIKDGVNGMKFDLNAKPSEYVEYILNLFSNFSGYKELCYSSFNEYKTRLNWDVSGSNVNSLLLELLN